MRRELIFVDGRTTPVGVMYGVGKNYAKHIEEMGDKVPDDPIIFLKPPGAYVRDGSTIELPDFSDEIHHEVELVAVIGKECRKIKKEEARKYIAGYAVGIDLTLRDVQRKAKEKGAPWAVAKGFAHSAPISKVIPAMRFSESPVFNLKLKVNGELRQSASTSEMLRTVEEIIEYLSGVFILEPGDCVFTGTPEGVGKIERGDEIEAELEGFVSLKIKTE